MASAIDHAGRLAASGRADDAERVLAQAGCDGDATAWMQLAVWRLTGEHFARDLEKARAALRRATQIGHADAALMEIALTANGTGGPADWGSALELLNVAARIDHIAARQLALIAQMALDENGFPAEVPVGKDVCDSPLIRRFANLISSDECEHIARVGLDVLAPATVYDPISGRQVSHPVRTSHGGPIGPTREDLVIRAINQRIAAISGTAVACGEPLTVLRYHPGQEYRLHHDAVAGLMNQRSHTVLLYLNDNFEGGETVFPDRSITISPRAGDALLFANLDATGRPVPTARHAGIPVRRGTKWLATRWIRERPLDVWRGDA